MVLIPWRRVESWSCTSCGLCCTQFRVILTPHERDRLVAHFGRKIVEDHPTRPKLRKVGSRCFFQRWYDGRSYCLLQATGLKPSACRIFPFLASWEPLKKRHEKDAFYLYDDYELYIYVNDRCPSVRLGRPTSQLAYRILPEVAQIMIEDRRRQVYTTSLTPPQPIAESSPPILRRRRTAGVLLGKNLGGEGIEL